MISCKVKDMVLNYLQMRWKKIQLQKSLGIVGKTYLEALCLSVTESTSCYWINRPLLDKKINLFCMLDSLRDSFLFSWHMDTIETPRCVC